MSASMRHAVVVGLALLTAMAPPSIALEDYQPPEVVVDRYFALAPGQTESACINVSESTKLTVIAWIEDLPGASNVGLVFQGPKVGRRPAVSLSAQLAVAPVIGAWPVESGAYCYSLSSDNSGGPVGRGIGLRVISGDDEFDR